MRTAVLLFALALVVRLALVALYPDPAYVDSYYYVNVARALAAGHGFNIDFVWTFVDLGGAIPARPGLPIPSNAHWMPLASLVQVPFIVALGATAWASALPFALVGALAAPMTWAVAREADARRDVALGSAILVAGPLAMVFMAQPDNFALFQVLVLGALWLGARGIKGDARSFAASGLLVGLAMLARNDGFLVGGALAIVFFAVRWRAWRSGSRASIPWWSAVACFGLFLLVMAPWWTRQVAIFGSISPSSASGRILWIRSLDEMNSIVGRPTIETFLGQGLGPLVGSRLVGLLQAILSYSLLVAGPVLVVFVIVGGWLRRRSPDFAPFFVYVGLLFAFSAIVSAVHVPNGTFLHSAVALAPWSSILGLEGVVAAAGWMAARRRGWDAASASRAFVVGAVALSVLLGAWFSVATRATWSAERDVKVAAGAALDAAGAPRDDVVMSLDTGGVRYWTGHPGVVAPADPIATVEDVARAYHARWLLVEAGDAVPALAPVLDPAGAGRPAWIGPPIWTSSARDETGRPAAVLVPVCLEAADGRCAPTGAAAITGAGR